MEDKINIAREKLEITFPLKEKQSRSVSLFLRYKHLKKLNVWRENYVSGFFIRNVWREMNVEFCHMT